MTWRRDALGLNMPFGNAVEFHPQEVGQLYTLYTYIYYLSCFQHIYKTHILIYTYIYTHVFMYILLLYIPLYGLSLAYPHAWMGKN